MNIFLQIALVLVVILYTAALIFIVCYSCMQASLLSRYVFLRKKYKEAQEPLTTFTSLPLVTVQLPVYNEKYVAARLLDCIAKLEYPAGKLEIQVLDDSTDETVQIIADKVAELKSCINIQHIHRTDRKGFKAGALKEGLTTARGELIAIFDADFLPGKDFLRATVPHFVNEKVGMVQTRWSWLNKSYSILTKLQAFALDAHFSIEQVGRNISEGFINFNGTAGVWRKSCIIDAGNWQADTLTEDLDLSYRAQLKNWKFVYLEEVEALSELPPVMSAVKTQQYRWNKGGAETAKKHMRKVIFSGKPFHVKWHGIMHLLTSGVFLSVFTCTVLSVPMLVVPHFYPLYSNFFIFLNYLFGSLFLVAAMYLVAVARQSSNPWQAIATFIQTMPAFLCFSLGLSLHNALAVLEGYAGKKTPFVRTPKFNITGQFAAGPANNYVKKGLNKLTIAEVVLMLYFGGAIFLAFRLNDFSLLALHILLMIGYGGVVFHTFSEHLKKLPGEHYGHDNVRLFKVRPVMAKHLFSGWAILALSMLSSCGQQSTQRSYEMMLNHLLNHSVPEISVADAVKLRQCVFLDAREKKEYDISHIANAVWVGYKTFDPAALDTLDKNASIIVYCSIGYRSEKVAEKLLSAGYRSVSNLYGGLFEWVNNGNLVFGPSGRITSDIHAYNRMWSKWLVRGQKVYD